MVEYGTCSKFTKLFDCSLQLEEESLEHYLLEGNVSTNFHLVKEDIANLLSPLDDGFNLSIVFDEAATAIITDLEDIDEFINDVLTSIEYGFEEAVIKLEIFKRTANLVNVYSVSALSKYLNDLPLEDIFSVLFNESTQHKLNLNFLDLDVKGSTSYLSFGTKTKRKGENREFELSKIRNVSSIENWSSFRFVPTDFLLDKPLKIAGLDELFARLHYVILILSLADFSRIEEDEVTFTIKGYKRIQKSISFRDLKEVKSNELFKIYNWVFSEGNLTDKMGLARNLITLNQKESDYFEIRSNCFESIQSSYEIYLKDNVKEYLSLRSKMAEDLVSLSDQLTSSISSYSGSLQKNFLGLLTFFSSTVLLRIFRNDVGESFDRNVFFFILFISIFSLLVGIYLKSDSMESIKKTRRSYNRLKSNYLGVLHGDDLNNILDNDNFFNQEERKAEDRIGFYFICWLLFLIVLNLIYAILFIVVPNLD